MKTNKTKSLKAIKKISSAVIAAVLALGAFTVNAAAAPSEEKTVVVSIEAFSVGCGYVLEPTLISISDGDTAATAVKKALEENNISYDASFEYGFYLKGISFEHTADIPEYITNAVVAHDDEYDEDILFGDYIEEDATPNDLASNDYVYGLSGWMYTINQPTAESLSKGMSQAYVKNGDVIRVQFSLDCGADIGTANLSGMPQWGYHADFYETADKTELTRAIAESSAKAQSPLSNALKKMKQTAAKLPATQAEVDSALSDYNTILALNPISSDVDRNNKISIMDAIMIQKAVLSISELSGVQTLIADCNGDGEVSVLDAILVQKSALSVLPTTASNI